MRNFAYERAASVSEVLTSLDASAGASTYILAGGTTLVDLMRLDVINGDKLVDITGVRDLDWFDTGGEHELVFGSLAKMSDVSRDPLLLQSYPAIAESLQKAASEQLRNMATLGGNLLQRTRCEYFRDSEFPCNKRVPQSGCSAIDGLNRGHALLGGSDSCIATYPGDFAIALIAFDAMIDVVSQRGSRTIPIAGLHRLPGTTPHLETDLAADELIVRIRVPVTSLGRKSTYEKVRDRESYAFATVSCAAAVQLEGSLVTEARIALGGVATKPWRAARAEALLTGSPLTWENALKAGVAAFDGATPTAANKFKMSLGPKTVAKALMIAKERNA
jgi:xanthine dehydrogenase YagS FAD-binding subunit